MLFTKRKTHPKRFWKKILIILAIYCLGSVYGIALAATNLVAFGVDTTAGSPSFLKVKSAQPNQQVNFIVNKPDGTVLTLTSQADQTGNVSTELYDYHTKLAGKYVVSAYLPGQSESINQAVKTSFKVYPGEIDLVKSTIETDRSIVKADQKDFSEIKVNLKDTYGNSIPARSVKLISNRVEDLIEKDLILTNENGQATFKVSSLSPGLGSFSAMDTTDDQLLAARVKLSFVSGDDYLADAGGDLLKIANAADVGPLNGFSISDLPASIKPNQNITFKVKAIDDNNQIVQDYTGTIRFSAEGDNSEGVTLPANYKFLAADLGQHTFNLGISFNKSGTYKVVVNDLTDKFKIGEVTVVVADTNSNNNGGSIIDKSVITSPMAGTYSQSQQTITGTAKSSSTVKIYDNNQQIGNVPVGPLGKFSYQTDSLADGKHSIYVVNLDTITNEVLSNSDPVNINIDTTPPKIDELKLDPSTGIKPGSVIKVQIYSEANLSQAAVIFNFDIVQLTANISDAALYEGTIQAPQEAGSYALNVLLVDQLANEGNYEDQAKILVDPSGGTIENNVKPDPTNSVTDPVEVIPVTDNVTPKVGLPSQVNGLIAYGSDKRITLVWDAATDDKLVKNYKIYYGQDVKNLSQSILSKDASTTWYIPGLENGKEYFFAVTARDDEGNESLARSEIVSAIPYLSEVKNTIPTIPTQPITNPDLHPAAYDGPFPPKHAKNGPEIGFLIIGSLMSGMAFTLRRKKQ